MPAGQQYDRGNWLARGFGQDEFLSYTSTAGRLK
jgi:hypothetical protein